MKKLLKGPMVSILLLGLLFMGVTQGLASTSQELAKEQTHVVGLHGGDLGTLDPISGILGPDVPVIAHIYGSLVRHPIGDALSLKFEPDLATKWEVSADKMTWTFHLRKGVKWHWGYGEVTSEDVVYSLNRVKNGKMSAWGGHYKFFKEIKAIDDYTVRITTAEPDPFLLTKVANFYGGFIICKKALEKAGAFDKKVGPTKEQVVGTGAFKFLEYRPKDRITLLRNDDYWEGKPIIEKIVFKYIPDEGARGIALLKGELTGGKGYDDDKWIKHVKSKGIIVERLAPVDLKALYFNLKVKPFDDKRVREAFAYGFSQESIIRQMGEEISGSCTSPIPSRVYGHIDAGWAKYKRNPEKARKLLAEAGYPNGLTVKMFMSVGSWYLDKMIVIQDELRECGITLEMTKVDHSVYKNKVHQGENPIVIWGLRLPLGTYWLRNFYHTDSAVGTPRGANNFMHYSNPEVDRFIELAETSFDDKVRLDALAKAQRLVVEDLPSIGVVETWPTVVRHPWFDPGYEAKSNFIWNYQVGVKTKILKH